jgi:hypothetical protein
VADYPDRPTHGYRVSQLFSSKMDPGEILEDYRTTRHPERFYNLKIGIPWADLEHRLDVPTVLALCRTEPPPEGWRYMGVDTGKRLHVVVLQTTGYKAWPAHVVHLEVVPTFEDLDRLMREHRIWCCVIDGLPETHKTREFAERQRGRAYMSFFNEHQRGSPRRDYRELKVEVNRTEALDGSRAVIREGKVTLPPPSPRVQEFARHLAADAKRLEEDEDTGAQRYRYIRTGEDHFSLAFTYAVMALELTGPPLDPRLLAQIHI